MATPALQAAFTIGEVSPSLFGRFDLARLHSAASTMRNMFVSYRGGAYSRAGTKFVGFSKQTGRDYPPRLIPFQRSVNQGLVLEFGDFYIRVISNGDFVTEGANQILGISQANPGVVTYASGAVSASTASIAGVTTSYATGDTLTIAGGVFTSPAVFRVSDTTIKSLALNSPGTSGYAPGDTVILAGGVHPFPGQITVLTTQVVSATVAAGGAGIGNGVQSYIGTTGTGTMVTGTVNVSGGAVVSVISIAIHGAYTVNPTVPSAEPIITTGGGGGAQLNLRMGILTFSLSTQGVYTVNAASFTQASTSGAGVGATFDNVLYGPNRLAVVTPGTYTAFPANPVAQFGPSTSGGLGATYTVTWGAPFADGDWVVLGGDAATFGMNEVRGGTYVVAGATATTFILTDVYGDMIDTTGFDAYGSGGTVARIYTLTTPYSEVDLDWIKFTESIDVMSLCCVNQDTGTEYEPQDLTRISDSEWTIAALDVSSTIAPPASVSGTASAAGTADYRYVVTSVSSADGSESIASAQAHVASAVNISQTAGSITLTWDRVDGASEYYVYKALPAYDNALVPAGSLYGFAGQAYGLSLVDNNIVADFAQVPPFHRDPFAPGQAADVLINSGGTGYSSIGYTVTTSTGSGLVLELITQSNVLVAVLILQRGQNYQDGDTITITGAGSGAQVTLLVGPQTGTFPSVVTYFQQRRAYANSLNDPDTYWLSQPGAFRNYDYRIPTIDSDAITGSPWSVEVNGIQFMIPMPGGLVVMTGLEAYLLSGAGGSTFSPQPLTPSSQQAQPQGFNGCSSTVQPIRIYQDIIYLQSKGSVYRDFAFQVQSYTFTGADLTINSSHLFIGYTIRQHAWCEEPSKVMWAVRNDGILLSMTYLKEQQVFGWARHDTNGIFVSDCSVSEPPVDALYVATQRFPGNATAYMVERMDNRVWASVEDTWCVDCGLRLDQPEPDGTLTASSATGLGALTGVENLIGGEGYSASTTAAVVDNDGEGPGSGAAAALTIVAGVITSVALTPGAGYISPKLVIADPTNAGRGASADIILDNSATFTCSAAVFDALSVGRVLRMGGGIATITAYISPTSVTADISSPIVAVRPNSGGVPLPAASGTWTMTRPSSIIDGLTHLAGATVTGIADGNVITPRVVSQEGKVTLDAPVSSVTIGLGFQAQLQTVYIDAGEPTVQGQRKKIAAVTARIEASREFSIGSNQPDGSVQSPQQIAPVWRNMTDVPSEGPNFPPKSYNATAVPLRTGDVRVTTGGGFATPGQIAIEQSNPLPLQVLAIIPEGLAGDTPSQQWPKRGKQNE